MSSTFSGDETAPFFGFLGAAAALVFSCMGAAYGTAKSGVGVASMGVMRPELVMKSIVPVVMAGVLGIYGLIIAVIISTGINPKAKSYYLFDGYAHLSSGLACGLAGLSAGMAIGIVGDAGVRANAQQPKLFVGMILILIFAEALALYGLIVGIILSSRAGVMDTPEDVVFKIHHGGVFFFDPLRYEQGQVTIMKAWSTNRLRFNELCNVLVNKIMDKIWAVFCCIPGVDLEGGGLMIIERDSDLQVVYDMAKKEDYLHLYVAHEPQLLAEYYEHNLCLEGSDEEVTSARKEHEIKKKHAGNMSVEELIQWAQEEAKSPYLRSPPKKSTPVRNGFKGKALFGATYDEYDRGCDIPIILDEDDVGKQDLVSKPNVSDNVVIDQADNLVEERRVDEHMGEVEVPRVDEVEVPRVDEVEVPRVDEVDVEEASIDAEVLARQKTLNKGKGVLTKQDIVKNKKRNTSPRGNGITIRENQGPLSSESDSDDSEMGDQYGNYYSETESLDSDKSFDYLSDIEDEVIELRKRKRQSKQHADEVIDDPEPPGYGDMAPSIEHVGDTFGETVREHEHYMESLMRKLAGNGEGVSDPFVMVEKPDDKYPIYDDQTHWRLKKPKVIY
ncbi:hypothetical protein CTI12_AA494400 [Artemisia annua]|uniref:V-type proton ATPase proteolipid subunit n=1 Tax=Artemisia annua TaxID=35608 RepID=A0A2U1LFP3_ARTAN|nr:hypothetical protein CTI12_AA494400 [Artemisia annua]